MEKLEFKIFDNVINYQLKLICGNYTHIVGTGDYNHIRQLKIDLTQAAFNTVK